MTDQEWIERLEQTAPAELAPEEIEALRLRLEESTELRLWLADHLQFEEALTARLSRPRISAEIIVDRASRQKWRKASVWGWILGLFLLAVGGTLWFARPAPRAEIPVALSGTRNPIESAPTTETTPKTADRPPVAEEKLPHQSLVAAAVPTKPEDKDSQGAVPKKVSSAATRTPPATAAPPVPPKLFADWPELADEARVWPVNEAVFVNLWGEPGLGQSGLRHWLEPVVGQQHHFHERERNGIITSGFDGLVRLRAPWRGDSVLRFAPYEMEGLSIHFWNGESGVTVTWHPQAARWAGYQSRRDGTSPRPLKWSLLATDSGRYERATRGVVEFRHQAGSLVMSSGDLRLMTLPLPNVPDEVDFERKSWFRIFEMYRGASLPEDVRPAGKSLLVSDSPGSLMWQTELPENAQFESDDTHVRLVSTDKKKTARAWLPVKTAHPVEFLFRVSGMTPGTGLYLGDQQGRPICVLGFQRERRTGWTTVGWLPPDAGQFDSNHDPVQQPVPFAGSQMWLRLVPGSGCAKSWVSGDGIHWSQLTIPARNLTGPFHQVGLIAFRHEQIKSREIALERIDIRKFSFPDRVAPKDLAQDLPESPFQTRGSVATWLTRVIETRPVGVESLDWRSANALQTLASLPESGLGNRVLEGWATEQLRRSEIPVADRAALLDLLVELFDSWDAAQYTRLTKLFEEFAQQLLREDHPYPFQTVESAWRSAAWSTGGRMLPLSDSSARAELLGLVATDAWEPAAQRCEWLRFYHQSSDPNQGWINERDDLRRLVEWVEGSTVIAARGKDPRGPRGRRPPPGRGRGSDGMVRTNWRHPLLIELNKEGFNTLAEVQIALSEKSYADACRVITSTHLDEALGLLPAPKDPNLLTSLPQAVSLAMRDFPELRKTMVEQFSPLAQLRVRQAIATGNEATVQAATVQFFATTAASEAHEWLGDRALETGNFGRALSEYERALAHSEGERRMQILARQRLAAALIGESLGGPAEVPIQLKEIEYSAVEFEALVSELRTAASGGDRAGFIDQSGFGGVIAPPTQFTVATAQAWQGDEGKNAPNTPTVDVDWSGLQSSCVVASGKVVVSNRYQVWAVNQADQKLAWAKPLEGEQGEAHAWHLTPMKPLVTADRVFVRRLTAKGPELVCLALADGAIRWSLRPAETLLTDPILMRESLLLLSSTQTEEGILSVELMSIDPQSGSVLRSYPLVRLMNGWQGQVPASLTRVDNQILAAIGGSVLAFSSSGELLWVRRETWIPPTQNRQEVEQLRQGPFIGNQRVVVLQPGAVAVECLDQQTGRRLWSRTAHADRRIVGLTDAHVILERASGFVGVNLATGATAWERRDLDLLAGLSLGSDGQLLYATRDRTGDQQRVRLVWMDANSGQDSATTALPELTEKTPLLGPLAYDGTHLWALYGRNPRDNRRDLLCLTPTTPAAPFGNAGGLEHWTQDGFDALISVAARIAAPGWQCLASGRSDSTGTRADVRGETNVCVTLASQDQPVLWTTERQLPAGRPAHLVIRAGHEPTERWALDIRVNGQTLEACSIDDTSAADGWKDVRVDLSAFAGQTATLVVEQQHSGKPAYGLWKSIAVVIE